MKTPSSDVGLWRVAGVTPGAARHGDVTAATGGQVEREQAVGVERWLAVQDAQHFCGLQGAGEGNVESLEFLNYSGTDWRDSWDTALGDPGLPQAVRVRIQLAANVSATFLKREPLELLVPLTTQARTNQPTTGGTGG